MRIMNSRDLAEEGGRGKAKIGRRCNFSVVGEILPQKDRLERRGKTAPLQEKGSNIFRL